MVTMKQIDEARARSSASLEVVRSYPQGRYEAAELREARDHVEALLREWWAQGCLEQTISFSEQLAKEKKGREAAELRIAELQALNHHDSRKSEEEIDQRIAEEIKKAFEEHDKKYVHHKA